MKRLSTCPPQLLIYGMLLKNASKENCEVRMYSIYQCHKNDLEIIRIRTKAQSEYIISQQGDYTMIGIQLCGKAIEEAKQAAAAEAQAVAEAEKAKKGDKEQS
ncbi:unnamed protein product (macronuclear) [Paramecium tetraurelia]|uniref:Uncharacterized protein n=1 Tax=Paramecium tetraurelia TaxID=5888 RepID=A0D5B4_PARTE|nr:uncharacterized protein GSPATT00013679001 [Paramecium tetraurelia]CAK78231.1 unnamed protein product [Paramecium tetraurelia]|eukprot:XP_001445628.1 hypothetical protein (macronuclear) [Paramecium tetraurelia strain d4-2]